MSGRPPILTRERRNRSPVAAILRCGVRAKHKPLARFGGGDGCRALPSGKILRQRGPDPLQRPLDLLGGDHKWRGDADRVDVRVLGKDASLLQGLTVAACAAWFRMKLDRQHQPASAYLADGVGADAPEAIEEARALDSRVLDHALLDKHAQRCPRYRAGERVAAEGRTVLARFQ